MPPFGGEFAAMPRVLVRTNFAAPLGAFLATPRVLVCKSSCVPFHVFVGEAAASSTSVEMAVASLKLAVDWNPSPCAVRVGAGRATEERMRNLAFFLQPHCSAGVGERQCPVPQRQSSPVMFGGGAVSEEDYFRWYDALSLLPVESGEDHFRQAVKISPLFSKVEGG